MTHLLAILALTCAWIHKITPESSIIPYLIFCPPVPPSVYLSFVYQILSLLHHLQHCCEGYSADMAQRNTWKGCHPYDIPLLTANIAAASWYNRLSRIYVCPSGRYTSSGDSLFSSIHNTLSMNPCNSGITHRVLQILNSAPILCHAVTSNARALTQNDFVERSHMLRHMFLFRFSVLHLPNTKG